VQILLQHEADEPGAQGQVWIGRDLGPRALLARMDRAATPGRLAATKPCRASLLDSQFAAPEEPTDAITVSVEGTPDAIVAEICEALGKA
jgi:hypothetical protein